MPTSGASTAQGNPSQHGEADGALPAAAAPGASHRQRLPGRGEEGAGGPAAAGPGGPVGAQSGAARADGASFATPGAAQQAAECGGGGREGSGQEGQG